MIDRRTRERADASPEPFLYLSITAPLAQTRRYTYFMEINPNEHLLPACRHPEAPSALLCLPVGGGTATGSEGRLS